MEILSKRQSVEIIKKLDLNRVPEIILNEYDEGAINLFCDTYVDRVYMLRDLSSPSGKYFACKSKKECLENARYYKGEFALCVSYESYEGKVLLGDIMISNNRVIIGARSDKESHHRNIYENPCINLDTDWDDKRLWRVDGVKEVFDYLLSKHILDVFVEFVVYDRNVGVNNNCVLIVEMRSKY